MAERQIQDQHPHMQGQIPTHRAKILLPALKALRPDAGLNLAVGEDGNGVG